MPPTKSINFKRFLTYLSLLLLGGVFLGPLVTYATLTLDSTSITTDDTLKLKGGNVGVGNITPTSNLHVSGTLNVTATSTAAALSVSGASALTGALTLSNPSTNSLIYTNSTGVVTALASSTAGKILTASGTAPYFSWETTGSLANLTLTGPSTNSPIYLNSAGLIASLASSTAGKVLMATSTAPYFSWETDATGGTVSTLVADGSNEITVGSTTSALTVNIANVANTALQTINIGGASAATSTVNILSGAGTQGASTLNLGNSRQVSTIALGNGDPAAALTINIGSGSTGATSTSINMGNGTAANTITLGAGTGGHTINIGTGTTTAKTINIGTAANVVNVVTIGSASSTVALTSASWTVTTAGTSTIVNKRTVNSSTFPTSPVDGQVVLLRAGNSPFEFLEMTYDATYGKWVSQAFLGWQGADGGADANYTDHGRLSAYVGPFLHPWRSIDAAGLKLQFRLVGVLYVNQANTPCFAQVGYAGISATDANPNTTALTGATSTEVSKTPPDGAYYSRDSGWQDIGTYTVNDLLLVAFQSKKGESSAYTCSFAGRVLARWVK